MVYFGKSGSISNLGPLADGQLVIGNSDNPPVAASLTAGNGIAITSGPGSITLASTVPNGNVVGPSSAVDANFCAFDSTTGTLVKDAGVSSDTFLKTAKNFSDLQDKEEARSNLGVKIGKNVQAWSKQLDSMEKLHEIGLVTRVAANKWKTRRITSTDSSITVTNPSGSTGNINISGKVVQQVRAVKSNSQYIGSTLPYDNTIPQNTEGDEVMKVSITPKDPSNILVVEAVTFGEANVPKACMAIFQDFCKNALFATACTCQFNPNTMIIKGYTTARTLQTTTFKMRCGPGSQGTYTLNGTTNGAQIFGGETVPNTTLLVTEYSP